jgi:hypothetical protein
MDVLDSAIATDCSADRSHLKKDINAFLDQCLTLQPYPCRKMASGGGPFLRFPQKWGFFRVARLE